MDPVRYIQVNAEALSRLSKEEQKSFATYLYLGIRFQSGLIRASLPPETCKKAGVCRKTLKRWIHALKERPQGSILKRLIQLKSQAPDPAKWISEPRHNTAKACPHDVYVLRDPRTLKDDVLRFILAGDLMTRARCTLRVTPSMTVHQIFKEIQRKVFNHHGAQVRHQQNEGVKAPISKGEQASNDVMPGTRVYPDHWVKFASQAPRSAAQMPSDSLSKVLLVHRSTVFRRVSEWEGKGYLQRINRKRQLKRKPKDEVGYAKRWGVGVFKHHDRWWVQLPNLYIDTEDYTGGWGEVRRAERGFGKTVTQLKKGPTATRVRT